SARIAPHHLDIAKYRALGRAGNVQRGINALREGCCSTNRLFAVFKRANQQRGLRVPSDHRVAVHHARLKLDKNTRARHLKRTPTCTENEGSSSRSPERRSRARVPSHSSTS